METTAPLGWNESSAPTACAEIGAEARSNRRILIEALAASGLTNYPGEWWHWSYGDAEWARVNDCAPLEFASPLDFDGPGGGI